MTFAVLLPYMITLGAGYLMRHFNLLSPLASLLPGLGAASSVSSAKPGLLPAILANHPVLNDAASAAIKQAVSDAVGGHMQSLKAEIQAAASAAVNAALADLKAKA